MHREVIEHAGRTAARSPTAPVDPLLPAAARPAPRENDLVDSLYRTQHRRLVGLAAAVTFDSAVADPGRGLTLTNNGANASSFVREGTYPDGTPFKWFGFAAGDAAAVMRIFVSRTDGSPATPAETALMHELQCATGFQGLQLGCG